MNILESEIEAVIFDAIQFGERRSLRERGLPIYDDVHYVQQLCLGNYGRADIVGFYTNGKRRVDNELIRSVTVEVFELKKEQVDQKTVFQALRYAQGIKHLAAHEGLPYDFKFHFHLVGKSIDTSHSSIYLADFNSGFNFYTYSLSLIKGLVFRKECGYSLIEPGFKKGSSAIKNILIFIRVPLFSEWHFLCATSYRENIF